MCVCVCVCVCIFACVKAIVRDDGDFVMVCGDVWGVCRDYVVRGMLGTQNHTV